MAHDKEDSITGAWGRVPPIVKMNPPKPEAFVTLRDRNGMLWRRELSWEENSPLTLREAGQLLGCNHMTAWRWFKAGNLKAKKKTGGVNIVRFRDVCALAKSRGIKINPRGGMFLTG